MENISLILSDLDGTLFRNDKSISDFTKQMIARAQASGILFGISTARASVNAVKFLDGIKPDVFISNGGGLVMCGSKKIYSCEFTPEETRSLIDAAFEFCGAPGAGLKNAPADGLDNAAVDGLNNYVTISIDNEKGLYCNSTKELGDKFWTFTDFKDFNGTCMKMCIETQDREKVAKVASVIGEDNVEYLPFSDIPWYKLSKRGATKEKAIEALCKSLNISPKNIAAFGDDFNDIGMLTLCGTGVAMSNAIKEVKDAANEVCLSNEEDGVAHWIEKFLIVDR
ncbi:HAD family hydrolase [Treponema sp.]|uniref:HAD family hydrolase n=1 Tax=Treponema sp. TaxID=166 RepID=UPI00388ECA10